MGNPWWPACVEITTTGKDGKPIGTPTGSSWNFLCKDTIYRGESQRGATLLSTRLCIC